MTLSIFSPPHTRNLACSRRGLLFFSVILAAAAAGTIPLTEAFSGFNLPWRWNDTPVHLWGWAGIAALALSGRTRPVPLAGAAMAFFALAVTGLSCTGSMTVAALNLVCFTGAVCLLPWRYTTHTGLVALILLLLAAGHLHFHAILTIPAFAGHTLMHWFLTAGIFILLDALFALVLSVAAAGSDSWEHRLNLLASGTGSLVLVLGKNRVIEGLSGDSHSVTGAAPEEWIGSCLESWLPRQDYKTFISHALDNPDPGFHLESILVADGEAGKPVEISRLMEGPSSKNPDRILVLIRDMSRMADIRAELEKIRKRLANAEKMEAQGILSGGVAHDLNNILSGITTYPEILLMDETLPDHVHKGLKIIKESGSKATAIVSDLLTLSRSSKAEITVISINKVVENHMTSQEYKRLMRLHPGVDVTVTLDPDLMNIRSSYMHMEKSLMNLVSNAVDEVSGRPGARVAITTSRRALTVPIMGYDEIQPGNYSVLSVSDNGSGIDPEALTRIFEPYFSKKELGRSGTGLGLTIVRNTVLIHGGYIDIVSDNTGTWFSLYFPSVQEDITELEHAENLDKASLAEIRGSGQKILVVDDISTQLDIASTILEKLGYEAFCTTSGEKALACMKKENPDLVILDMILYPGMSGLETYKKMIETHPGQKALLTSGNAKSDEIRQAQAIGAGQFIPKPYSILDLGKAVKEELEK
ncbi:MAG: response regulator [Pseudomonadota bacterium]